MIRLERFGDITRIAMSWWRSRTAGYGVSAFSTRGALIDTGFPGVRGEFEPLLDTLRPDGVILTHYHEDHAGNAELVARRGIPLAAPPATLRLIRSRQQMGAYRRWCWGAVPPLASPVVPFEHPMLELVPTPGHSADHHAVWDAEREVLFAGDLFLGVKVRVARPGEDPRILAASLRQAAALRPRLMFDSHRGPVAEPTKALIAKAEWLEDAIAMVDRYAQAGWSDGEITRAVLGKEEMVAYASFGDLSRLNFVRAVRTSAAIRASVPTPSPAP